MRRLLIIYTPDGSFKKIAEGLKKGAEEAGFKVDMVNTADNGTGVSFFPYDLVAAGSPTKGIFRGKIDNSLKEFLSKSKRTLGQDTVAFVSPRFFAAQKALKNIMALLEKEGCVVKNFFNIKDYQSAVDYGRNLKL